MDQGKSERGFKRSLLVTGGCGFIGCNFVRYWLNTHPLDRICVLDSLTYAAKSSSLESLSMHPAFRFVHGDIRNTDLVESLLRTENLDTVVHFAAESHVDRSISGPDIFLETNVIGTHSLLKAARRVWLEERDMKLHRFHHVSTDEVYGSLGPNDPAFTEKNIYAPNSPYSASKAASDHIVRSYHHTYGLNTTISNCSNNYGPYQFPEKLIPLSIINILDGKPLPIYGDGRQIRDWLHAEDHVRAIELILATGAPGETYNVGGAAEIENILLVKHLCSIADDSFSRDPSLAERFPLSPMARGKSAASLISHVQDRPGHDRRYAMDFGKLKQKHGYEPVWSITAGLSSTWDWYVLQESWWRDSCNGENRASTGDGYSKKNDSLGTRDLGPSSENEASSL
jgi:dTDP-glucose 4,6-dehydratase